MKRIEITAWVAVATILPYGSTVSAHAETIVTASPPTLASWSDRVFKDIDREIRYPEPFGPQRPSSGVVAVKFNCSESGAPAGVALLKSSGHRDLDRETLRAVNKIATLHPLPPGLKHDQLYVVRVLYANSHGEAERQLAKMREEAAQSNAWYNQGEQLAGVLELVPSGG
ncbi:energy transducer TonB family protein [Novosphingobium panipatense]|uniref:TonB family C-terminal domain-containing protein n=1 Tax=Novosphingobium panipatense TaxID=428991 RepID=A0ABY1Q2W3_9SPHN|nr:energy transducer TonB [Novosphingobium panipatense]SMP57468.1 TonB family C-terminal domain-containing protein [Novosphingobium panipatense]